MTRTEYRVQSFVVPSCVFTSTIECLMCEFLWLREKKNMEIAAFLFLMLDITIQVRCWVLLVPVMWWEIDKDMASEGLRS